MLVLPLLLPFLLLVLLEELNKCFEYSKFLNVFSSLLLWACHNTRTYERLLPLLFAQCPNRALRYVLFFFFSLPVLAIFYRLYPDGNGKFFHSKTNWLPFNLEHSSPGQSFWYVMFTIFCHSVIHLEPPFRTHPLETRWFIPSTAIELSFYFWNVKKCQIEYPGMWNHCCSFSLLRKHLLLPRRSYPHEAGQLIHFTAG